MVDSWQCTQKHTLHPPALNVVAPIQCSGWLEQLWDGSSHSQLFFLSLTPNAKWSSFSVGFLTIKGPSLSPVWPLNGRHLLKGENLTTVLSILRSLNIKTWNLFPLLLFMSYHVVISFVWLSCTSSYINVFTFFNWCNWILDTNRAALVYLCIEHVCFKPAVWPCQNEFSSLFSTMVLRVAMFCHRYFHPCILDTWGNPWFIRQRFPTWKWTSSLKLVGSGDSANKFILSCSFSH